MVNKAWQDVERNMRVDACEAVVVGAGLIGAAIAAQLAAEGVDVALLEARRTAGGATSRTAGLILTGLPMLYTQAIARYGRETARALWQLTLENQQQFLTAAERLSTPLERTGSLVVATDGQTAEQLDACYEQLRADGFTVERETVARLGPALLYPNDLALDPVALTQALLDEYQIPVHHNTEVYRLTQDGQHVLVQASGRTVRAGAVILAVNVYANLLDDYFKDKVSPARGYALMTRVLRDRLLERPGRMGDIFFRQTAAGQLILSMWREYYDMPAVGPTDRSAELDLMRFAGKYFPQAIDQFAHRWSGVTGAIPDGLPLLGALPHLPQVFFAVGFAQVGLSMAMSAADLLSGMIMRGAEPGLLSARRLE